ncbi:hypothetical protein GCM10027592_50220 [Spirosoma flavus]
MTALNPKSPVLKGWIPYRLNVVDNQLNFRWLYVGEHRFREPFFDETIARCQSHSYNSSRWHPTTQLSGLLAAAEHSQAVEPDAFIFHVSRCGSTLLSQLLSIPEEHCVISEMPLIDNVLRLPYTHPTVELLPEEQDATLKAVITMLGVQRTGYEKRLFIKLDSWHFAFYNTLRRLYPTVPFIFLYRSPDAVLRSHQKHRGMQAVPGVIQPELFGLNASHIQTMSLDSYTAAVLEFYFRSMLNIKSFDANVHLLRYQENGTELFRELVEMLALDVSSIDEQRMFERSRFHAKRPDQPFQESKPIEPIPSFLQPAMNQYYALDHQQNNAVFAQ